MSLQRLISQNAKELFTLSRERLDLENENNAMKCRFSAADTSARKMKEEINAKVAEAVRLREKIGALQIEIRELESALEKQKEHNRSLQHRMAILRKEAKRAGHASVKPSPSIELRRSEQEIASTVAHGMIIENGENIRAAEVSALCVSPDHDDDEEFLDRAIADEEERSATLRSIVTASNHEI
uniref:Uncharacterized protein n=1 Tax=Palpitomonas bilix TaxID=652834 RepID=A0A7S3CWQ6_9EUKA|mmetsp:Transcript_12385/g.33180  ORF Transcript_12385/g.33180 Transcript_12385/m.33180 type:complete len:184 (+) Transcript_12385:72-623(+)